MGDTEWCEQRVRLMARGVETWDLSDNDMTALRHVLGELDRLRATLRKPEREVVGWTVRVTRGTNAEPWLLYPQRDEPSCLGDRKTAHVWSSKGDAQKYCCTWGEGTPVKITRRKKAEVG